MSEEIDDQVEDVRRGNLDAYRRVISLSESKVRLVLAAILPEPQMIEDLAQEVFLQIYDRLGEYRQGTDFFAWIKELARHSALNERRRWVRRQAATRRYRAQVERALERDLVEQGGPR
ncbi:MAG: hypothetical protein L0170_11320, partial [Acidobacteria bacterium]|nr:hypothetical protein [Acidobacteriota bacterium]